MREYGKGDERVVVAQRKYFKTCSLGRQEFAKETPDMLKYQPTRFWGMIKKHTVNNSNIQSQTFAEYN